MYHIFYQKQLLAWMKGEKNDIILQASKKLVVTFVDIAFNETKNDNIDDAWCLCLYM